MLGRRRKILWLFASFPERFAALQVGMDHSSLDRSRPHDRDFDDEVIEFLRAQPRQHRHLRTALDLKGAERVGALNHFVDRYVLATFTLMLLLLVFFLQQGPDRFGSLVVDAQEVKSAPQT